MLRTEVIGPLLELDPKNRPLLPDVLGRISAFIASEFNAETMDGVQLLYEAINAYSPLASEKMVLSTQDRNWAREVIRKNDAAKLQSQEDG
jgi:hypothetical protein